MISPFVDRQHGTERVLAEQLQKLSQEHSMRVELYSQAVQGLDVIPASAEPPSGQGSIAWHPVPAVPGPHLLQYFWWFAANSLQRLIDRRLRKVTVNVTFSPGINALEADVIAVHIVFHAFYDRAIEQLRLAKAPLPSWPRRLHRRMYYRSIMALERRIYRDDRVVLLPVSQLVAKQLRHYFGRADLQVIPNGVAVGQFHPEARLARRESARAELGLAAEDFVILLIGNDWVKKGLSALLQAAAACALPSLRLLVVGTDDPGLFAGEVSNLGLQTSVRFLPPRDDVLFFYAAADAYAGPSLEDAFGLPILEAMACGLPVIASANAGASEAVTDGVNGLVLRDPLDTAELENKIQAIVEDGALRVRLGAGAAQTAKRYSWEQNAQSLRDVLIAVAQKTQRPNKRS